MVTGVRHWSSPDSSTVVVDLEDQVNYEAHRLSNPERIYFDLPETSLAASWFGRTVEVDDGLLQRVRVAQPTEGTTRIVLETKGSADYSVSLEQNPYRLVVEVRKVGSKPQAKVKVDLFAPAVPVVTARTAPALTVPQTPSGQARVHAAKFSIVLDAGHGGWDLGTVGRKGLLEKDLVLDIVARLGSLVEKRLGGDVIYTRQNDTYIPLEKRTEIANLADADLFVSIHANYSDSSTARGVETYYTNTYSSVRARTPEMKNSSQVQNIDWTNIDLRAKVSESRKLAASVQQELYNRLATKNPGLRNRGVKEASYVVLTGTTMPAILAEVSFVSSPTDEAALQSPAYRQQIAEALYKGIARYVEASHHDKIATASGHIGGR
jgi:N-acetylmuramoyl-L-alanine amidase